MLFVDYGEVKDIFPIHNEIHHEIGVESAVHEPIMCLRLVLALIIHTLNERNFHLSTYIQFVNHRIACLNDDQLPSL